MVVLQLRSGRKGANELAILYYAQAQKIRQLQNQIGFLSCLVIPRKPAVNFCA